MTKKLGVMVSNLGASHLNFLLIKNANDIVGAGVGTDVVAFYESLARPCLPMNFAAMQTAECWGFDGAVVATTVSTAEKLLRFPAVAKRLFYVWDLEWIRRPARYRDVQAVYGSPLLTLLARNKDHAQAISQAWNRDVAIVEDFSLTRILEVAGE